MFFFKDETKNHIKIKIKTIRFKNFINVEFTLFVNSILDE